jgi:hypothetical protein
MGALQIVFVLILLLTIPCSFYNLAGYAPPAQIALGSCGLGQISALGAALCWRVHRRLAYLLLGVAGVLFLFFCIASPILLAGYSSDGGPAW